MNWAPKYWITIGAGILAGLALWKAILEDRQKARIARVKREPHTPWLLGLTIAWGVASALTVAFGVYGVIAEQSAATENARQVAEDAKAKANEAQSMFAQLREQSKATAVVQAKSDASLNALRRVMNKFTTMSIDADMTLPNSSIECLDFKETFKKGPLIRFLKYQQTTKNSYRPWEGLQLFYFDALPGTPQFMAMIVADPQSPHYPTPQRFPALHHFLTSSFFYVAISKKQLDLRSSYNWFLVNGRQPDFFAPAATGEKAALTVWLPREEFSARTNGMSISLTHARRSAQMQSIDDLCGSYFYIGIGVSDAEESLYRNAQSLIKDVEFQSLSLTVNGSTIEIPPEKLNYLTLASGALAFEYRFPEKPEDLFTEKIIRYPYAGRPLPPQR